MIGTIIGDVIGSRFEFDNIKEKKFDLFSFDCEFTDDTVLTAAIADIFNRDLVNNRGAIIERLQAWSMAYPKASYGASYRDWYETRSKEPYNSFGNGSAMRVSPVGWVAQSEEEVKVLARKVTDITHNNKEGIRGAEVVAMCVFYARTGKDKDFIRTYVESQYPILKNMDYEELRRTYHFWETCQMTVPQAVYCFLISTDFEDAIRTAISIGGDSDTVAAITGGIAEAFYGLPQELWEKVSSDFLDKRIYPVVMNFYNKFVFKNEEESI